MFAARSFESVTVGELVAAADVTTGALYHHFDSKLGLYSFARADVERRLIDRMEGAAAAQQTTGGSGLSPVLTVGFDFAVQQDFIEILGQHPNDEADDPLAELLTRLTDPAPAPLGLLLAAAWRAALNAVAHGQDAESVRGALASLHVDLRAPTRS